ncbi:hypothetical protein [Pseudomonas viridiflava]|uniref:hypothetical protein n=2 Tax=Pseudomonas viridiflava TaxID=33069 RepID=UPI0013CEA04F|nr:hypothetical protein [Pseudomonas viridiflava]WKW32527.1 hypothetical protein KIH13_00495 [Pseudomonas viridiflava]
MRNVAQETNMAHVYMEMIRDHWLRVLYVIAISIFVWLAYVNQSEILFGRTTLDRISYWGTVATMAGLLVTLIEVLHNIRITKGVSDQAKQMLLQSKRIDNASHVSDCTSSLDDVNSYVSVENYLTALKCFQQFRKSYAKIYFAKRTPEEMAKLINSSELSLHKATHTSAEAPLTKRLKNNLQKELLDIKSALENSQPSKEL